MIGLSWSETRGWMLPILLLVGIGGLVVYALVRFVKWSWNR